MSIYEYIWAYMSIYAFTYIWAYGLGTKGLHLHSSVTYGAWCAVQMWHLWSHIWEYVLLCQVFKLTTDLKSSYDLRSKISWILKRNCMCVLACDDTWWYLSHFGEFGRYELPWIDLRQKQEIYLRMLLFLLLWLWIDQIQKENWFLISWYE